MDNRNYIVSKILLFDGVLLIVIAFAHLLATPLINRWLSGALTSESLKHISLVFLLNHIVIGVLLIPFGVSTLYSASGVRAGQPWARGIAITNALVIMLLPLLVVLIMGASPFDSPPYLAAGIAITVIGATMFVPLIWVRSRPSVHRP